MRTKSLEIQMLHSLIDEPKRTRQVQAVVGIDDMTADEYKAYKARLQAERRAKIKAAAAEGKLAFDTETTRDALADAALAILATDAPGADAIRNFLAKVFHDKPGVPLTATARAKSGELKAKLSIAKAPNKIA